MPRQAPYRGGFNGNAAKRGGTQPPSEAINPTTAATTQNNTNS